MARIIIADDDEFIVDLVRSTLESQGHVVGALPDGEDVCRVLEIKRPDLLILDCSMPNKSGMEALREIRQSRIAYDIPVLVLTGRLSDADETIAFQSGADDYLRKPVNSDDLLYSVDALLGARLRRSS